MTQTVVMRQFGANGAAAEGTFRVIDATHNEIDLTLLMLDGETWRFREHDTITGPNEFQTVSYRFRDAGWVEQARSTWTRMRR